MRELSVQKYKPAGTVDRIQPCGSRLVTGCQQLLGHPSWCAGLQLTYYYFSLIQNEVSVPQTSATGLPSRTRNPKRRPNAATPDARTDAIASPCSGSVITALSTRNALTDVNISGFPIQVRCLWWCAVVSRRRIRSSPTTAARKHEYSARPACEQLMSGTLWLEMKTGFF